jgi:hypothetical protein
MTLRNGEMSSKWIEVACESLLPDSLVPLELAHPDE